jgi:hypothetical protein
MEQQHRNKANCRSHGQEIRRHILLLRSSLSCSQEPRHYKTDTNVCVMQTVCHPRI